MSFLKLNLIVAACDNMGIGYNGDLPWRLSKEMAHFVRLTKHVDGPHRRNAVVMGRKTWCSIPANFRPLAGRLNLVLTKNLAVDLSGATKCTTWENAIDELEKVSQREGETIDKVWIIGGSSIYQMALDSDLCHRIYFTRILHHFDCDVYFPPIDPFKYKIVQDPLVPEGEQEENGIKFRYEVYERR